VIPQRLRGTFFGIGNGLGALLGVAGGIIAGRILEGRAFPGNYALCFTLASVAMIISWAGVSATREPPSENPKAPVPMAAYLRRLPLVLKRDRNYARYLVSQGLAALGGMGTSFLIVFGRETYGLTGAQVGTMTAVLVGSQAATNLLWGYISDRTGHKAVLAAGSFALAGAMTLAWTGGAVWSLGAAFALLGAGLAANAVSRMNIVLEFGVPQDRPTYIGLTNTSLAPVTMLAPLIGGWLVEVTGYVQTFGIAAGFAALGGLLLAAWFRDPRRVGTAVS
jgi:MFS family permease